MNGFPATSCARRVVRSVLVALVAIVLSGLNTLARPERVTIDSIVRTGAEVVLTLRNVGSQPVSGEVTIKAGLSYNDNWVPEWSLAFSEHRLGILTLEPGESVLLTIELPLIPDDMLDTLATRLATIWTGYRDATPDCDQIGFTVSVGTCQAFAFLPLQRMLLLEAVVRDALATVQTDLGVQESLLSGRIRLLYEPCQGRILSLVGLNLTGTSIALQSGETGRISIALQQPTLVAHNAANAVLASQFTAHVEYEGLQTVAPISLEGFLGGSTVDIVAQAVQGTTVSFQLVDLELAEDALALPDPAAYVSGGAPSIDDFSHMDFLELDELVPIWRFTPSDLTLNVGDLDVGALAAIDWSGSGDYNCPTAGDEALDFKILWSNTESSSDGLIYRYLSDYEDRVLILWFYMRDCSSCPDEARYLLELLDDLYAAGPVPVTVLSVYVVSDSATDGCRQGRVIVEDWISFCPDPPAWDVVCDMERGDVSGPLLNVKYCVYGGVHSFVIDGDGTVRFAGTPMSITKAFIEGILAGN